MEKDRGFTIIELLIAVAVLAILVGVAAPPLRDLAMNAAMTNQANDLMGALMLARSEAVRRNVRVGICTSTNGTACTNSEWREGWIVFLDADRDGDLDAGTSALRFQAGSDGASTVTSIGHGTNGAGARYVSYVPSGALDPGTLIPLVFTLCDSRTVANVGGESASNKGRSIPVSATGRGLVQRITCP